MYSLIPDIKLQCMSGIKDKAKYIMVTYICAKFEVYADLDWVLVCYVAFIAFYQLNSPPAAYIITSWWYSHL